MALDVWMLPLGKGIFSYDLDQPLLFVNSQQFHRWDQNVDPLKKFISNKPGLLSYHCLFFLFFELISLFLGPRAKFYL